MQIIPLCTSKRSVRAVQCESVSLIGLLVLRTGIPLFGFGFVLVLLLGLKT